MEPQRSPRTRRVHPSKPIFLPWGSTISKGNTSLPNGNGRLNPANISVISVSSVAIYGATEDTEGTAIKAYFLPLGCAMQHIPPNWIAGISKFLCDLGVLCGNLRSIKVREDSEIRAEKWLWFFSATATAGCGGKAAAGCRSPRPSAFLPGMGQRSTRQYGTATFVEADTFTRPLDHFSVVVEHIVRDDR